MDFNVGDCGGGNHHLFTELDAGNVIIIDFVMMNCSSCITGTDGLRTIAAPYGSSHPGRVHIYTFGYTNSISCSQMQAWMSAYGFTHTCFSGDDNQVSYYGGMGMPTIVVVGKNNHEVLYKKLGYEPSDNTAVVAAIETGLQYNPQGIEDVQAQQQIHIFPSLIKDQLTAGFDRKMSGSLAVFDLSGRKMAEQAVDGQDQVIIGTAMLEAGIYAVIFTGRNGLVFTTKVVKE